MHASHAGFGPMLDSTSSAPPLPEVGDIVNSRYRLDREAGRTEAGVVFDATDRTISRRVVVELASSLEEPAARRKWARDAMQAQRLEGEHVLRVLDVGYVGESVPYVVREAAICTLTAEIAARGPLPIPQAVALTLEACEALAEAHALGMAHGDLRPDNMYIARGRTEATLKVGWTSAAKAERAAKEDIARDIAGLGAMLKILVTGQLDDENEGATTLPSDLAHAVARALAQDPDGSFHNVAELARALAPFAPPGHTSARTVAFLLSRAGIVGAAIPAAPAPAASKAAPDRASFTDEWFARASRTSLVFAEPGRERRRMSFALVSAALLAMVIGGSWFLWETGKLPHWSGTAPPEAVGTTQVTSGAPEPAADPNANANASANAAAPAAPAAAASAPSTPVEALPNVDTRAATTTPTPAAPPAPVAAAPAPQTQAPVTKTPAHAPVTSAPPSPPRTSEPRNVDPTEAPAAEESSPAQTAPTSPPEPVSPEPAPQSAPAPQTTPAPQPPQSDLGPGY